MSILTFSYRACRVSWSTTALSIFRTAVEDREDDMVNVNINAKTCHNISLLPLRNSTNKSVIKPQNNSFSSHKWQQHLLMSDSYSFVSGGDRGPGLQWSVCHTQKMAQRGPKPKKHQCLLKPVKAAEVCLNSWCRLFVSVRGPGAHEH